MGTDDLHVLLSRSAERFMNHFGRLSEVNDLHEASKAGESPSRELHIGPIVFQRMETSIIYLGTTNLLFSKSL